MPKLNDTEKDKVDAEISLDEIKTVIETSKNNKSPGPVSFSNKFYKIFWRELNKWLIELFDNYRETDEINVSQ